MNEKTGGNNVINERLAKAINEQINKEFFSAYLYLSMSSDLERQNLSGYATWMNAQFQEEQFHALKMFKYLTERGGVVVLDAIEKPQTEWKGLIDIFECTLDHEISVTKSINDLMAVAMEERDFAAVNFIQWYVNEQVEEESNVESILQQLRMVEGNGHGVLMLDRELGQRVFVEPTQA